MQAVMRGDKVMASAVVELLVHGAAVLTPGDFSPNDLIAEPRDYGAGCRSGVASGPSSSPRDATDAGRRQRHAGRLARGAGGAAGSCQEAEPRGPS
jgi:hypothetical protein